MRHAMNVGGKKCFPNFMNYFRFVLFITKCFFFIVVVNFTHNSDKKLKLCSLLEIITPRLKKPFFLSKSNFRGGSWFFMFPQKKNDILISGKRQAIA